jgi:hypothetical protein
MDYGSITRSFGGQKYYFMHPKEAVPVAGGAGARKEVHRAVLGRCGLDLLKIPKTNIEGGHLGGSGLVSVLHDDFLAAYELIVGIYVIPGPGG